jgi:hypothetical protein
MRTALRATRSSGPFGRPGPGAPPGKVIAELTFGFWRYLSTTAHHHPLWIPYLHTAFRPGTSRQAVDGPVDRLHQLRNRIAHHEPLLRRNTATGVLSLTTHHLADRLCGSADGRRTYFARATRLHQGDEQRTGQAQ